MVLYSWLKAKGIRVVSVASDIDKKKYEEGIRNFPWQDKLCDFKDLEASNFSNYNVIGTPYFLSGG